MTLEAEQSRVDALIRLVGAIVTLFGAAWLYQTAFNTSGVASEIVTINYALGLLLLGVGLLALLAKLK